MCKRYFLKNFLHKYVVLIVMDLLAFMVRSFGVDDRKKIIGMKTNTIVYKLQNQ